MIRNYITQALTMMRQHKLFTGIYIAGTALAISFTMVLFILYYIKLAPIYPEYNRARTMVFGYLSMQVDNTNLEVYTGGAPGYTALQLVKELPSCDKACIVESVEEQHASFSAAPNGEVETKVLGLFVSDEFWQIFDFEFLAGAPMLTNGERLCSENTRVVISESFARRLYGTADAVGRDIYVYGNKSGQVGGVVKDVSGVMKATAADIYVPLQDYAIEKNFTDGGDKALMYITTDNPEALKSEFDELISRLDQEDLTHRNYDTFGQPHSYSYYAMGNYMLNIDDIENSVWDIIKRFMFLLLIPALNLCVLISSRMDERVSEFGVRKAYGASRLQLVKQVLCENLLLTFVGGVAGLVISYVIVCNANEWIFQVISIAPNITSGYGQYLTPEMLFNLPLVVFVLLLCALLNVISALVPALWAMRRPIVESLNNKR